MPPWPRLWSPMAYFSCGNGEVGLWRPSPRSSCSAAAAAERWVIAVARLQAVAKALRKWTEIILERGSFGVPGGPQRAIKVLELGDLSEAPLLFVDLSVVGVRVVAETHADQAAAGVVSPGVEGASEDQAVALVVAAHLHAAVTARIQEGANLIILAVPHEDHLFGAHAAHHEVSGIRQLALVAEEQPAPLEDLLHLLFEDVRVDVNLSADCSPLRVDV